MVAVVFRQLRRMPALIAAALPLLLVPLLRIYIVQHGSSVFPEAFQPHIETVFNFYDGQVVREAFLLAASACLLLLLFGFAALRGSSHGWKLHRPEWALAFLWTALPGLLMLWFMHTHAAFWPRYGAIANLGIVVMATALFARWTNYRRSGALVLALAAVLYAHVPAGLQLLVHPHRLRNLEPEIVACVPCQIQAETGLPLVDASGITFVEMSRRESKETLANLYYLQDTQAAHSVAHASIFDGMPLEQQEFHLGGHVVDAKSFLATHRRFLVFGTFNYQEQWLLRKLAADGARVRMLRWDFGSYLDQELYLVEMQ